MGVPLFQVVSPAPCASPVRISARRRGAAPAEIRCWTSGMFNEAHSCRPVSTCYCLKLPSACADSPSKKPARRQGGAGYLAG